MLPGLAFGMLTFGALPNNPLAVTDEFTPADAEDDADDDDEAVFDEPQPARTTQASRGMAMIARKRRMKTSMWWMSASLAYWHHRA
jgi:hypothetical protein